MGGYIPAPSKGVIDVQNATPDAKPGRGWWDPETGRLTIWSTLLNEWVPVGEPSPAVAYQGLQLGRGVVTGTQAVAVGNATADGSQAVALGNGAVAGDSGSIAIGDGAVADDSSGTTAIGRGAQAHASNSWALGYQASVADGGSNSWAMGYQARVTGFGSSSSLAFGYTAKVTDAGNAVAIGHEAEVAETNGIAIGYGALIADGAGSATALGYNAESHAFGGLALGYGSTIGEDASNGTAVGYSAEATAMHAVAVGAQVNAVHQFATALGFNVTTLADQTAIIGAMSLEVAQVGAPTSVILTSPDGSRWALGISDSGVVTVTAL